MKRGRSIRVSCTSKRSKEFGEAEEENTNSGCSITELPKYISFDILLRLSVNRLLVCRCVCKTWRSLISDPEFAKLHFAKGEVYPLIRPLTHVSRTLYLVESPDFSFDYELDYYTSRSLKVHFKRKLDTKLKIPLRDSHLALNIDRETNANVQSKSGSRQKRCIKLRAKDHRFNVANSCHGLLCLSEPTKNDPVVVCNPITGEYINLPIPTQDKDDCKKLVDCALGFSPPSKQYKVIRMFSVEDGQSFRDPITGKDAYSCRQAEVHILGTCSWRRIGHAPYSYDKLGFPTYLNGAVHWVYRNYESSDYIISFDFVNEKFQPFPPPREVEIGWGRDITLGVLRGCLCMCNHQHEHISVWVMKHYGVQSSWRKKHSFYTMTLNARWVWGLYEPISVSRDGGLLLFHRMGSALFCYHPERNCFKLLELCGVKSKYDVISYVPSFVSLKDAVAGEELEVVNINSRCAGLKLLGETKTMYLEEEDAGYSHDYGDGDSVSES